MFVRYSRTKSVFCSLFVNNENLNKTISIPPMYLQSTSLTHGHSSLYLYPGTWVQSSVSLQIGLKWFVNLWDTYWVLGPGSGAKVQPRFYASWFLGPRSRDSGPGLQTCSRNSAEKLKFFEFIFMPIQSLHFLNIYQKCEVLESQFQFYLVYFGG